MANIIKFETLNASRMNSLKQVRLYLTKRLRDYEKTCEKIDDKASDTILKYSRLIVECIRHDNTEKINEIEKKLCELENTSDVV